MLAWQDEVQPVSNDSLSHAWGWLSYGLSTHVKTFNPASGNFDVHSAYRSIPVVSILRGSLPYQDCAIVVPLL